MRDWIQNIPVQLVVSHYDYMEDSYTYPPDTTHVELHETAERAGVPAFAAAAPEVPPPNYIALYSSWKSNPTLQAPILLHEAYHFSFPTLRSHDRSKPWINPYAYEGLVSTLGGLALSPELNRIFPP
jgi:hypothetical protein